MAKTRTTGTTGMTGVESETNRDEELRDAIASKLFVQMAPMAESRGKTIDCIAARSFEMADIFLRVRAERTASPTE